MRRKFDAAVSGRAQDIRAAADGARGLALQHHVRKRRREQNPPGDDQARPRFDGPAHDDGVLPGGVRREFVEEARAAHLALGADAEGAGISLVGHAGAGKRRDLPRRFAGGERLVVGAGRLENEPAAHGTLRQRRVGADLPADGLQAVPSRDEVFDKVGVGMPVVGQAAVRPAADLLAVKQQDKALVGGDVELQGWGAGDGVEIAPEAKKELRGASERFRRGARVGKGGGAPLFAAGAPDPRRFVNGRPGGDVGVAARVALGAENPFAFHRKSCVRVRAIMNRAGGRCQGSRRIARFRRCRVRRGARRRASRRRGHRR